MKILAILFILLISSSSLFSATVIIKNDNGIPRTSYQERQDCEETVFLVPDGPCKVVELQIYYAGTTPGKDTVYFVGDPAEGAVSPTFWCLHYNMIGEPIIFDYDGNPGWRNIPVNGIRSDGYDRIVIQHRLNKTGPWFGLDNDGTSSPMRSWLMDPYGTNSLGGPGQYYNPGGDYLVRIAVEYDYPNAYGSSLPPPPPLMPNVILESGIDDGKGNPIRATSMSIVDWNNDGYDDIAIGSYYFENNGDGTFKKVDLGIVAGGTAWADFDNDGDLDVYAIKNGPYDVALRQMISGNQIYLNENGTFVPIKQTKTFLPPYPNPSVDFRLNPKFNNDSIHNPYSNITALWVDYNNDGFPDLYLANNRAGSDPEAYFPDELWKNNGNGTFSRVTDAAGIAAGEPYNAGTSFGGGFYDCYGACAVDYNQDNKQDIFVANYRLVKDNLYKNNGDGTFLEVGASTGVQGVPTQQMGYYGHGMGAEWGDFNNDGLPDLCVGNLGHPDWRGAVSNPSLIFKNNGAPDYNFEEVHKNMGLKFFEMNAGVCWLDLDLDGYIDLAHGQISYDAKGAGVDRLGHLYLNTGPENNYKLQDVTWLYGTVDHGPWCPGRIDYDFDGDLDLIFASNQESFKLFRNDLPRKGDWVAIRLLGSPQNQVSNDAFGSKVICYAGGKLFYRDIAGSATGSLNTQSSKEMHFGLGKTEKIDSLVIIYPNGQIHRLFDLPVNRRYTIEYKGNAIEGRLTVPALKSPQNFAINFKENRLEWYESGAAESYFIQLSDTPDFSNMIFQGNSSELGADINIDININKTYYWRVRASKGEETTAFSSVWSFTTGKPLPKAPILISPKNDSTDISALPQFSWQKSIYTTIYQYETKYSLQIAKDANFEDLIAENNNISELSYKQTDTLTAGNSFFWRVCGTNEGERGPWSEIRSFKVIPLPETPLLISPANGESVAKVAPFVEWQTSANSYYYHLQAAEDPDFHIMHTDKEKLTNNRNVLVGLANGKTYYWRVAGMNDGGSSPWSEVRHFIKATTSVEEIQDEANIIENLTVSPNPFTNFTQIQYNLKTSVNVKIVICNILGEEIETLVDDYLNQGTHISYWKGGLSPQGVYFVKIYAGNNHILEKIVLLK